MILFLDPSHFRHLCYVMLCYVMLCYVMLCYVMLSCVISYFYTVIELLGGTVKVEDEQEKTLRVEKS